jgi:MFS transporter, FSR family, fosmidomycin resistance protein
MTAGSHFVTDIYQSFYIGLIPILTYRFELSLFRVTLLGATSIIANSLFSPVFAYFSDRHGLKYYILAGPLLASVFLSLLGIIPNYWVILIFLFIGNLGIASFHPASAAIAGHYGGVKKGIGTSMISFGGNFGYAFGSLAIILIIERAGIRYTPLAMIAGAVTALLLFKYIPFDKKRPDSMDRQNFIAKVKSISKIRLFKISSLIFTMYCVYIVWISLLNYMPLYLTDAGLSLTRVGMVLFLFGALGGSAGFLSGHLYDKFQKANILMQISLLSSAVLVFFIFSFTNVFSIIFFIASGFFLISIQPLCIRMSQDLLPKNMSVASSLILGISPGLAGVSLIFLGKAADAVGIALLIRYELILLLASFIVLFSHIVMDKKKDVRSV